MTQWEVYGMLACLLIKQYANITIDYSEFTLADLMRQEAKQAGHKAWNKYMDGFGAMYHKMYGEGQC